MKTNGVIVLTASQPFTSVLICSNLTMFRYAWVWEKEQGVNFLSSKKNPMKVHEDICVFYLDEAEVKGRSKLYTEMRDYFKQEKDRLCLTRAQIEDALGNNMASHYFTNGVQWTLPTLDNYKKLQTLGGFEMNWEDLKNEYDLVAKQCTITYNPQMTDGKPYVSGLGDSGEVTGSVEKTKTVNNGTRYPRTVLKVNRETGLHPTQKPVALFEYLIRTYTNEGETILDNCAGSGTTGVAAEQCGRNSIMIERDPNYCNIIRKRMEGVQTGVDAKC